MIFEWDPAKAASNVAKHGVAFEAVEAFEFEAALVLASVGQPGGGPRLTALGPIGGRLHMLVYSIETRRVRVLSLRKANNREIARYAQV